MKQAPKFCFLLKKKKKAYTIYIYTSLNMAVKWGALEWSFSSCIIIIIIIVNNNNNNKFSEVNPKKIIFDD